jgi:hypothetical protein
MGNMDNVQLQCIHRPRSSELYDAIEYVDLVDDFMDLLHPESVSVV